MYRQKVLVFLEEFPSRAIFTRHVQFVGYLGRVSIHSNYWIIGIEGDVLRCLPN